MNFFIIIDEPTED